MSQKQNNPVYLYGLIIMNREKNTRGHTTDCSVGYWKMKDTLIVVDWEKEKNWKIKVTKKIGLCLQTYVNKTQLKTKFKWTPATCSH